MFLLYSCMSTRVWGFGHFPYKMEGELSERRKCPRGEMFNTLCMDHNVGPSVNMSDTENLTAELKNNSM